MSESFRFEIPEHFTAGTVGPRGQRTFYLQFGNVGEIVSLKCEKQQVQALAEFLDQLLETPDPSPPTRSPWPSTSSTRFDAAWTVSSIGVAYREEDGHFLLVVEELLDDEDRRRHRTRGGTAEHLARAGESVHRTGPRPRHRRTATVQLLRTSPRRRRHLVPVSQLIHPHHRPTLLGPSA
jgi:uncharacterized repeat protein (TIGR03847 family)